MARGDITTTIRCDVCGHQWFGCTDRRVNIRAARQHVQRANGFKRLRLAGKMADVCSMCQEKMARLTV
ncbi:MAG: hypothetical protein E6Q97_37245 [Desulfurellales bacterium]|jgi:hypothetical protein|nr:MAG: hypothetical protein E6Q97_37245 [Desulfurellales bacterium]